MSLKSIWKSTVELSEKLEEVSDVFVYEKKWERQEIDNLPILDENNFKFYVWQTRNTNASQFYSEEFYIWALEKLLKNTPKNSIITIEVWADLKNILILWEEKEQNIASEQIWYIKWLIEKNFKKYEKRIQILNLKDNHKSLFQGLEKKPKIDKKDYINNLDNNFNSNDIYNLLYQALESENWTFKNSIKKLVPKSLKNINNSILYPLSEFAFRITDYINWVYIQWWERNQKKFDVIIQYIINWWYNDFSSIKKIHDFIKSKDLKNNFSSLHFNKEKAIKEREKKDFRKKLKNTIIKYWVVVSLIILWPTAW